LGGFFGGNVRNLMGFGMRVGIVRGFKGQSPQILKNSFKFLVAFHKKIIKSFAKM
jgi:hypothetical protein